jgi:hypothetical protein
MESLESSRGAAVTRRRLVQCAVSVAKSIIRFRLCRNTRSARMRSASGFPGDKCAVQAPRRAYFQRLQLYSQCLRCGERLLRRYLMTRIQRIEEEGDVRELGTYFVAR